MRPRTTKKKVPRNIELLSIFPQMRRDLIQPKGSSRVDLSKTKRKKKGNEEKKKEGDPTTTERTRFAAATAAEHPIFLINMLR